MNRREQVAGADKSTGDKLPRVTQFPQATRNAQPAKCCEGAQEARTSSVFSDAIHAAADEPIFRHSAKKQSKHRRRGMTHVSDSQDADISPE